MWRKATCRCSSVDNVFTPVSMKNKPKKKSRSKKKKDAEAKPTVFDPSNSCFSGLSYPIIALGENEDLVEVEDKATKQACFVTDVVNAASSNTAAVVEIEKFIEVEDGRKQKACSDAHIKVAAAAVDASPEAAKKVVQNQMSKVTKFTDKSEEETATVRIQTAIRGYLARRALQSLKGGVRLKLHVRGNSVKQHTSDAMKHMQTRSHVLAQVRSRRVGVSQENLNQTLQRQLLRAKQLEILKAGDKWDITLLSKERIEANLLEKYEAEVRREKCLAYSYALQKTQNPSTKSTSFWSADQNNPLLGWIWFDRWMTTARQWEVQTKDLNSNHSGSLRIPPREVTKCPACRLLNPDNPSSSFSATQKLHIRHSPGTACSKVATASSSSANGSVVSHGNDSRNARSIAGSLSREDRRSLTSPPSVPSYMALTHSAMLKSKLTSPECNLVVMPKKDLTGSAKKRLSYPPAKNRRHLGADTLSVVKENGANGILSSSFTPCREAPEI